MTRKPLSRRSFIKASIAALAGTILAACGSQATPSPETVEIPEEGEEPVAEPSLGPLDKYPEVIDVTVAMVTSLELEIEGRTYDDNPWKRMLLDEYNINMTLPFKVDWTTYGEKLNLLIASGDIPDILCVGDSQITQLFDGDLIEDLSVSYPKAATELTRKSCEAYNGAALKYYTLGDKLIALASPPEVDPRYLWVRMDWLEKLGLPEPKTMADVFMISEAFTKNDPNGTGKDDTHGLSLTGNFYNSDATSDFGGFANGYHAYAKHWIARDGKIVWGSIQPEMKEALMALKKMYANGELAQDFASKQYNHVGDDIVAGKVGMEYGANWNPNWPFSLQLANDPNANWKAFPLPSIDDKPALAQVSSPVNFFVMCQKKGLNLNDLLVKLLNIGYHKLNESVESFKTYGIAKDGTPMYRFSPVYLTIWEIGRNSPKNILEAVKSGDPSGLNGPEMSLYPDIKAYLDGDQSLWSRYAAEIQSKSILFDDYYANDRILLPAYQGFPVPSWVEKGTLLTDLENEAFTKIVMGNDSPTEFEDFVKAWNDLGGADVTKEINEAAS